MGDIKTPRQAKGPRHLKILRKTSQSVYSAKLPPKSSASFKHAHSLTGARQVKRIDRQDWEERVANIHLLLEEHRHGRANRMYTTLDAANEALAEAMRKEQELVTFAEELNASNEEMRAANEEMRANAEEMRAANEELRTISEEQERVHRDQECLVPLFREKGIDPLSEFAATLASFSEQYEAVLDAQTNEKIAAGKKAIQQLTEILRSTREYWQIDQQSRSLERVDCEDVLTEAAGSMTDLIDDCQGRVNNSPLPELFVDKKSLMEIFTLLLDNSLRFRADIPPNIHVSAQRVGDWKKEMPEPQLDHGWVFSVIDNGVGIAEEHLKDIFHLFENLGAAQGGLGMGLAKTWRLVRQLGGTIWAESTPGKGTAMHFTVPDFDEDQA